MTNEISKIEQKGKRDFFEKILSQYTQRIFFQLNLKKNLKESLIHFKVQHKP